MTARFEGSRLEMVTCLLRERGPMTAVRIGEELDIPTKHISVTIAAARARRPGKSFRIVRYEPQTGRRSPDHPVWSASHGQDAERQPYDKAARSAAWEARRRQRMGASRNAMQAARRAAQQGRCGAFNPYLQLVQASSRGNVAAMAARLAKKAPAT